MRSDDGPGVSPTVASAELVQELGRFPHVAEIGERTGLDEDAVLVGLAAADSYRPESLDAPDSDGRALATSLGSEDPALPCVEARMDASRLLDTVPPREQRMLELRFWEGKTQAQIASVMGVSQMQVSRLLRRTKAQLREAVLASAARAMPVPSPVERVST